MLENEFGCLERLADEDKKFQAFLKIEGGLRIDIIEVPNSNMSRF